jgi:hypothetical protein
MLELVRITAQTAGELLAHFELSEDAQPLLVDVQQSIPVFIAKLVEKQLYQDAIKLLAHGLPKREAVWWACLSSKQSLGDSPSPDSMAAITAAEQWAITPTEENRQGARVWSAKTAQKTAASWAATAAFWAEGSMAKTGEPEIPAPPFLYAHAVAGSVSLAAFQPDPDAAEEKLKRFIRQGMDIAAGGRGDIQ